MEAVSCPSTDILLELEFLLGRISLFGTGERHECEEATVTDPQSRKRSSHGGTCDVPQCVVGSNRALPWPGSLRGAAESRSEKHLSEMRNMAEYPRPTTWSASSRSSYRGVGTAVTARVLQRRDPYEGCSCVTRLHRLCHVGDTANGR